MADNRLRTSLDVSDVSVDSEGKLDQPTTLAALLARLNKDHLDVVSSRRRPADDTTSIDVNVGDAGSCQLSDVSSVASWQNDVVSQDDELSCGNEAEASDESGDSDQEDCDDDEDDEDDDDDDRESMLLQRCIEAELLQHTRYDAESAHQLSDIGLSDLTLKDSVFDADTIKRTSRDQKCKEDVLPNRILEQDVPSNENGMDYSNTNSQASMSCTRRSRPCVDKNVTNDADKIPKRINFLECSVKQSSKCKNKNYSTDQAVTASSRKRNLSSDISEKCYFSTAVKDGPLVPNGLSQSDDNCQERSVQAKADQSRADIQPNDTLQLYNGSAYCPTEDSSSDVDHSSRPDSQSGQYAAVDCLSRRSLPVNKLTSPSVEAADELLTDVPLDDLKKTVSLETDAESAVDAASVVSDDAGKVVVTANGVIMPSVLDGLSSSDVSDADEALTNGAIDHCLSVLSDVSLPESGTACHIAMSDEMHEEEVLGSNKLDAESVELRQFKAAVADW